MATPKKPQPFVPSPGHSMTVGEAHQFLSTISAYGKVITGVTMDPSEAGTVHPQRKDESLQLALVFGTSQQGKCVKLTPPQKVYMPAPDGPADGCGWDPKEYVVWKNLPSDWNTVHVQTQAKPLAMALAPDATVAQPQRPLSDVLCTDWLGVNPPTSIDPSLQLDVVWTTMHGGTFTFAQQASLSNVIQKAYSRTIAASNLVSTTTVGDLASWIPVQP